MVEQEQPGAGSTQGHPDLAAVQPQADNDKLLGALSYIFWFLVPIIILVTDMKNSRFAKAHAYQGIVFAVVGIAFYIVYSIVYFIMTAIFWPLACVLWVGWFIPFVLAIYIAYKVFSGGQLVFPYLTDLTRQLFKDL
jgi:uncharacterized membrane protein